MKTKLVRPVLVESKEKTNIMLGDNITRNIPGAMRGTYYQLILISLENEKIEVGDKYYDKHNQLILSATTQSDHNIYNYKKVIATQSQLSPEYIQQFIEEYNKGDVKDVEIETIGKIGESKIDYVPITDNGYVTIVTKEAPTYTEEEMYSIMQQYLDNYVWSSGKYITPMEWFNQHKK